MRILNPVVVRSIALNPHMRLLNPIVPCASKSIIKVIAYNSKTILVVCYKIAVSIYLIWRNALTQKIGGVLLCIRLYIV